MLLIIITHFLLQVTDPPPPSPHPTTASMPSFLEQNQKQSERKIEKHPNLKQHFHQNISRLADNETAGLTLTDATMLPPFWFSTPTKLSIHCNHADLAEPTLRTTSQGRVNNLYFSSLSKFLLFPPAPPHVRTSHICRAHLTAFPTFPTPFSQSTRRRCLVLGSRGNDCSSQR